MESDANVTTVIARRVLPGREEAYEQWVRRIIDVGSRWPGHQSVDVIRPSAAGLGVYTLLVRFQDVASQQAWEQSKERARLLVELEGITDGSTRLEKLTGFETWFTLPLEAPIAAPNRHKMALVITVAVFGLVLIANLAFGPWLAQLPLVPRVALLAIIQVSLLTYVIMPRATLWLRGWLYPTSE